MLAGQAELAGGIRAIVARNASCRTNICVIERGLPSSEGCVAGLTRVVRGNVVC